MSLCLEPPGANRNCHLPLRVGLPPSLLPGLPPITSFLPPITPFFATYHSIFATHHPIFAPYHSIFCSPNFHQPIFSRVWEEKSWFSTLSSLSSLWSAWRTGSLVSSVALGSLAAALNTSVAWAAKRSLGENIF